ncbi:MAG: hypothetical protein RJA76_651 [Bacteroidota bacterium]|jgi:pectinesterase
MKMKMTIRVKCYIKLGVLFFLPFTHFGQNLSGVTGVRDHSYNNQDALKNDQKSIPGLSLAVHPIQNSLDSAFDFTYKKLGNRSLKMDYIGPKDNASMPALLFIHGGGWRTGDKRQHWELAKSLADKGFRVFLLEYRLSTEALYPAAMLDAHDGLRFLFENARKYKIDLERISVAGFSAGGQMAALLGATWDETLYGIHSNQFKIHSVIDLDGILAYIHPESGEGDDRVKPSAATLYFGYSKKEGAKLWDEASALYHVSKNDPAVLFINSGVDRMHAGRDDFRKKMQAFNLLTRVYTFEKSPHSFLLYSQWLENVSKLMAEFMSQDHKVLRVDPKDSSAFQTIQSAIDKAKPGNEIYIKNGQYVEKIWIDSTKNHITLRGESREGVLVKTTQARDIWRCSNPDDYGAATLNIKGKDIHIASMSFLNDYGFLNPKDQIIECLNESGRTNNSSAQKYALPRENGEKEGEKIVRSDGHQFAMRSMPGATRLSFENCNFVSGGGDTVSPWDVENGMYYFNNCKIEGHVDLYCPRGNALAENCEFICHNLHAAIWHDGSAKEGDRSIIKNSLFKGDKGFKLGRYHREAQIFLLNCSFDPNMADSPIYQAGDRKLNWGHRIKFNGSKGPSFSWLKNNTEIQSDEVGFSSFFGENWMLIQ